MSLAADLLGLVALIPAMTGSGAIAAQDRHGGAIVAALCAGGTVLIPTGAPASPQPAVQPCCAKGCRNGDRRRRGEPQN